MIQSFVSTCFSKKKSLARNRVASCRVGTSNSLVQLKSVTKSFAKNDLEVNVLLDITLSVYPSQIISIIGNSGSGKSTLLHIAGMLDRPSSGSVFFKNQDCSKLNDSELTKIRSHDIGFVYQQHHLLPEFTAIENLKIAQMINSKSDSEKALAMLDKFNLKSKANNYPSEMSGGENQRVAIARALVNNPAILLADEPTGNLDQKNSDIVFDLLLAGVRNNSLAAIIVTHNMALAEKTDMILKLENGRLSAI